MPLTVCELAGPRSEPPRHHEGSSLTGATAEGAVSGYGFTALQTAGGGLCPVGTISGRCRSRWTDKRASLEPHKLYPYRADVRSSS